MALRMRARSSIHESVRCGAVGKVDKALEHALGSYREGAPAELRLEAAKLCIDWYAALGSTDSVGSWPPGCAAERGT